MSQPTEYAVGFSAGAAACMYIFRQSASMLKEQREQKDRKNGNGNGSGSKPVEFWQREFREAVVEGFTTAVAPILQNQTRILEELRDSQRGIDTAITKLTTIAEFQK